MSRGGARNGRIGKNYTNRTDLNPAAPKALPPTAVPGQQYGQAKAQLDAQKIAPMANAPLATPVVPQIGQPQPSGPQPGSLGGLTDPTQRPNEHLMTGVAAGPGAGPEALMPTLPPDPANETLALLNTLSVKSPAVQAVVDFLNKQAQNQMPH